MPKLNVSDVLRNKRKIEAAALQVFVKQGFHGTSIRDIANASGVSIGNIYNYYKTKEDLYKAIAEHYETRMQGLRARAIEGMDDLFDPDALLQFAERLRKIVHEETDYWRLMYIDVTEFGNQHFAHIYRNLAKDLKSKLGSKLREPHRGNWTGVDPALAFTSIYLQFFTYFLVETLFGGKQHLGVPDDLAIKQMITIYARGLGLENPSAARKAAKAGGKK
jgi:AcrR family transcriptional regulator